jgi:hypothetical protein
MRLEDLNRLIITPISIWSDDDLLTEVFNDSLWTKNTIAFIEREISKRRKKAIINLLIK